MGRCLAQRPPRAWFSLSTTVDLGTGSPVIETNRAARDGRTTNNDVPTTSRAPPHMQERDVRRDVLGAIEIEKNVTSPSRKYQNSINNT